MILEKNNSEIGRLKGEFNYFIFISILLMGFVCFYYEINDYHSILFILQVIIFFISFKMAFFFIRGHGAIEKNRIEKGIGPFLKFRHWFLVNFKMPALYGMLVIPLYVIYIGADVFNYFISSSANDMPLQIIVKSKALTLSMVIPFIACCLYWKYNWREIFFFNEQELRMDYQKSKMPPKEIEYRIKKGKKEGLFG